jgi:ankyrin repeat protein
LEVQSRQPSLYFSVLIADHHKSYEIMKMLIEAGANPNFKDQYIQTVFFYACREGIP